ncbi:FAD-dependent oxidoreductase [Microbispora corallina]|uniref:3-(3-hydroxyphenyl)propionate hydroxylase n=1 Tax=Microbispora corallina TaxID=83302 RepID=A0ABQ4G7T2_9ACTN|nr:FAD-dependent monooxygenase [Microbispora corallina]GIH43053.1 3-(3-hydroxyphenyl)propionate hydroxylase [Microbispora corallina]
MTQTTVLIVGAGPTGLTLAVDLARRGVDLLLVDAVAERPGSRGKGLQPRTLEVFDDLGVTGALLATGAVYPPLRTYHRGQVVWEGRMHEPRLPTAAVPYPMVIMQPQWRTERVLRERLAGLGHRVRHGARLTGLDQDEDGVTAVLEDGERIRAAYLVGADGGRSTVRKAAGVGFHGETRPAERMLLGDVTTGDLDRDHWHMWGDPATRSLDVALCPLPGTGDFQLTAPVPATADGEEDLPEPTLETFQAVLDRAGAGVRLTGAGWTSVYRVNIRMAERFRAGRVFLAGDAAHVHSPAGGQGLNTGVQDAYNLGWKLAAVLAGAPGRLLATYEEERLPVAASVLGLSTALHEKGTKGDPDAHVRDEETRQLLLAYPGGFLCEGPRGGERVPDAVLGRVRLFDVLRGPHFTLLTFGDAAPDQAGAAALHGSAVRAFTVALPGRTGDLVDVEERLHEHFGAGTAVLVRPDGYVGYHGAPGGLEPYLSRVLGPR